MLARVLSCAVVGLTGALVQVEVDIAPGLPAFTIVGLPDTAVQEARDRVRAAIRNAGATFPQRRVTVNLAPADLRKAGTGYDLAIAVGILAASGQAPPEAARDQAFLGELGLDGDVRHVPGVLPAAAAAHDAGLRRLVVPCGDAAEAALVDALEVHGVRTLADVLQTVRGEAAPQLYDRSAAPPPEAEPLFAASDFAEVRGQEHVKRALEVAAAGGHNVLMSGPPGAGKTLLARALPGILPPLTSEEALEVTKIYSVSGLLREGIALVRQRPFRAPHHSISIAGLVGGGRQPRPGEISLAHHGVLFLDELPEFGMAALEALRQPLEDHAVAIARAQGAVTYPAGFMLVGAMNPCPCGYYGDPTRACTCAAATVHRYQRRISGPLLDRIDLFAEVPRVDYEKLASVQAGEPSRAVQARVAAARARQTRRFQGSGVYNNARMGPREVREHCQEVLTPPGGALLKMATSQLSLSARAFHRVLKVARTIADLAGSDALRPEHVAEAIQYRRRAADP